MKNIAHNATSESRTARMAMLFIAPSDAPRLHDWLGSWLISN
jgi:hypothetical protein